MTETLPKLTAKQGKFVDAFIETGNESESYRRAYNVQRMSAKAIGVEATRLMKHPAITLVLTSRQQALAKRHEITADSIVESLGAIAKDPEAPAAVKVSALMGQARIMGYVIDRREVKGSVNVNHTQSDGLAKYTLEQLDALLAAMDAEKKPEPAALPAPEGDVLEATYSEVADDDDKPEVADDTPESDDSDRVDATPAEAVFDPTNQPFAPPGNF